MSSVYQALLFLLRLITFVGRAWVQGYDKRVHKAMAALHTISDEVTIISQLTGKGSGEQTSRLLTSGCGCRKQMASQALLSSQQNRLPL